MGYVRRCRSFRRCCWPDSRQAILDWAIPVIQNMSVGHTYTFSPTVLLDGLFGYQRQNQTVTPNDYRQELRGCLGIPGSERSEHPPERLSEHRYQRTTADRRRSELDAAAFRIEENFTTSHNLTWTKGAHVLRFGFDGVLLR